MSAVVFGPDLAMRRFRSQTRIGLVLGAGGVLGAAGIRSSTSLSALSGTDVHEVYVLAPMASTEPDHPLQPHLQVERRLRQLITHLLLRQAKALSAEGKRVTIVTPGCRDLAVMGANLMDPRRRQDVLEVSLRTSADSLATLDRVSSRAA